MLFHNKNLFLKKKKKEAIQTQHTDSGKTMRGHDKKAAICKPKGEASEGGLDLSLDFELLELWKN